MIGDDRNEEIAEAEAGKVAEQEGFEGGELGEDLVWSESDEGMDDSLVMAADAGI
jgi:hypothetical protein